MFEILDVLNKNMIKSKIGRKRSLKLKTLKMIENQASY